MSKPFSRIVSLDEFTRQPRTEAELETYRRILSDLQRLGCVDAELNVVPTRRKRERRR